MLKHNYAYSRNSLNFRIRLRRFVRDLSFPNVPYQQWAHKSLRMQRLMYLWSNFTYGEFVSPAIIQSLGQTLRRVSALPRFSTDAACALISQRSFYWISIDSFVSPSGSSTLHMRTPQAAINITRPHYALPPSRKPFPITHKLTLNTWAVKVFLCNMTANLIWHWNCYIEN